MTEPKKNGNVQDAWARWKFTVLKIGELFDVDTSAGPTSGQTLLWNSTDKKWEPGTAGGFDPNEDPVIIGHLATAGGGSTPSSPTAGSSCVAIGASAANSNSGNEVALGSSASTAAISAIAIGNLATASASYGVAIGDSSWAANNSTVAIGNAAKAHGTGGIAVGSSALSSGASIAIGPSASSGGTTCTAVGNGASTANVLNAVAVGPSAYGGGGHSVALGDAATVGTGFSFSTALGAATSIGHTTSTAVGYGATTTANNQIVLGTSTEIVLVYQLDGSQLPTTNPGAGSGKVWNNAGVLTVA